MKKIRIATRQSPLALWQANFVKQQLIQHHPQLEVELLPMVTKGDILLDSPLAKIGGKGLFVKQLEQAILANQADLAVHSIKDIPAEFPQGLSLVTICARDDVRDSLVSNHYKSLAELPPQAIVGTSSLRRRCQLQAHYPHLLINDLRGNVGTRLAKLDAGNYDAIILAAVALKRLNLADRIAQPLATDFMLPAVGQGAVGIEARSNDVALHQLLAPLEHYPSRLCITAERAMNRQLQGGCQVPIAGFAQLDGQTITLQGLVGSLDGQQIIKAQISGPAEHAEVLGMTLANQLLAQGAKAILAQLSQSI